MSLPASINSANGLSAKMTMNAKLSTPYEDVLSAQGVGMLKRKAISYGTVSIENRVSKNASGNLEIVSASFLGSIPGAKEHIYVDDQEHKDKHDIYGDMITRARLVTPDEARQIDPALVDSLVLEETVDENGKIVLIESWADASAGNKTNWRAFLTTGVTLVDVNGTKERRWTRINKFNSPKVNKVVVLVYDFKEQL
ncbi:hypothetical protein PYCC9005_005643 [Savitreella phatthalungensis]